MEVLYPRDRDTTLQHVDDAANPSLVVCLPCEDSDAEGKVVAEGEEVFRDSSRDGRGNDQDQTPQCIRLITDRIDVTVTETGDGSEVV